MSPKGWAHKTIHNQVDLPMDDNGMIQCEVCPNRPLVKERNWKAHVKRMDSSRYHLCSEPGCEDLRGWDSRWEFRSHMRIAHKRIYCGRSAGCDQYYGKGFKTAHQFEKHKSAHSAKQSRRKYRDTEYGLVGRNGEYSIQEIGTGTEVSTIFKVFRPQWGVLSPVFSMDLELVQWESVPFQFYSSPSRSSLHPYDFGYYGIRRRQNTARGMKLHTKKKKESHQTGFQLQKPILRREWEILGNLEGTPVSCFPDSGSDLDVISRSLADRLGAAIDKSNKQIIKLPNGARTKTIGTVCVDFGFTEEKGLYQRLFHVMKRPIHDVILGNSFLRLTETLTSYSHRLREKWISCSPLAYRLRLLGSPKDRINGSLNGLAVSASPDTGAQINVISRSLAERLGFIVLEDEGHRTTLEFVNGSCGRTAGMVQNVEWRFGDSGTGLGHKWDFHVLDGLTCDLVLGSDLLFATKAFEKFGECFQTIEDEKTDAEVGLIKHRGRKKRNNGDGQINQKPKEDAFQEEVYRRADAEDVIVALPEAEQAAARAQEERRRRQWKEDYERISDTSASPSMAPSEGSDKTVSDQPKIVGFWRLFENSFKRRRVGGGT